MMSYALFFHILVKITSITSSYAVIVENQVLDIYNKHEGNILFHRLLDI